MIRRFTFHTLWLRPAAGRALVVLLAAALAGSCGGGAENKTGSNGTGQAPPVEDLTASAPLTGLGPESLGGISIEGVAGQVVINADGDRAAGDLRLGMPVELRGRLPAGTSAATAAQITVQNVVSGPLLAIDAAANRLTFPGALVELDANTIIESLPPLASLTPGQAVEVFGIAKPSGGAAATWLATRLAPGTLAPNEVSLLGTVTSIGAQGATVAGLSINSVGAIVSGPPAATSAPGTLALNTTVRVIGAYSQATNSINATRIITGLTPERPDNHVLVLDGLVQSVTAAGRFRLLDTEVRSTLASAQTVQAGQRVRVRGIKQNGVLDASEVQVSAADAAQEFRLSGEIVRNTGDGSIVLRGETIVVSGATVVGGSASDLTSGRRVRVRAHVVAGALVAREVTLL
jgi:hypothetical protein